MSIRQRGEKWSVTVYDKGIGNNRWVGTFDHRDQAERAEALAKATRGRFTWKLESKGEDICRNCESEAAVLHHIVPRNFRQGAEIDNPQFNGLPLCHPCHAGWHSRSVRIGIEKLLPEEIAFAAGVLGLEWLEGAYPGGGPIHVDKMLRDEIVGLRAECRRLRIFIERQNGSSPSKVAAGREQ